MKFPPKYVVALGAIMLGTSAWADAHALNGTTYHTVEIDELSVFYREAGPKDAPTLLLLHGLPSSSHMFRDLIPMLAQTYHVIAPDYPGFGQSSALSVLAGLSGPSAARHVGCLG